MRRSDIQGYEYSNKGGIGLVVSWGDYCSSYSRLLVPLTCRMMKMLKAVICILITFPVLQNLGSAMFPKIHTASAICGEPKTGIQSTWWYLWLLAKPYERLSTSNHHESSAIRTTVKTLLDPQTIILYSLNPFITNNHLRCNDSSPIFTHSSLPIPSDRNSRHSCNTRCSRIPSQGSSHSSTRFPILSLCMHLDDHLQTCYA